MANFKRKRPRAYSRGDPRSNYWWPQWYRASKVLRERYAKRELTQELEPEGRNG